MKKISIVGFLAAAWLVVGVGGAWCVPITLATLNLQQGFNYQKDNLKPFGFITSLTIDGTALTAELSVKNTAAPVMAVGVLESATWTAGLTDPLEFTAAISAQNRVAILALLHKGMSGSTVEIQFVAYSYDPNKKAWYTAFQSGTNGVNAVLKGIVEKAGNNVKLAVASVPTAVKTPVNYVMTLGVTPAPQTQTTTFCSASGTCVVKKWGVSVGQ